MSSRRHSRAALFLTVLFALSGCAYYNGVYNAKDAAKKGNTRLRQGREDEARTAYAQSAEIAETVLVRFPKSRWRRQALFLAGRGEALSGNCEGGVERLNEYLALGDLPSKERDEARLALSVCDVIYRRLPAARVRLDSLVDVKDRDVARQARLWAARAALAAGDRDAAGQHFAALDASAAQWELLTASLQANDMVRAESLLIKRASLGEWRPEVPKALRDLWMAGRFNGVEEIVQQYDVRRLRDSWRAQLHFLAGDLNLQASRDSLARQHLFTARRLGANDTTIEREAAARLALLSFARVTTLSEVDTVIARIDTTTRRSQYYRRMADHLLLYRLLLNDDQPGGAPWFLAAEVARDSLHAIRLAHATFMRIARERPEAALAPKALHAAAVLEADSAPAYRSRILSNYPQSSVAAWLRGDEPALQPDFVQTDSVLRTAWLASARTFADTVRKLRDAAARDRAARLRAGSAPP